MNVLLGPAARVDTFDDPGDLKGQRGAGAERTFFWGPAEQGRYSSRLRKEGRERVPLRAAGPKERSPGPGPWPFMAVCVQISLFHGGQPKIILADGQESGTPPTR